VWQKIGCLLVTVVLVGVVSVMMWFAALDSVRSTDADACEEEQCAPVLTRMRERDAGVITVETFTKECRDQCKEDSHAHPITPMIVLRTLGTMVGIFVIGLAYVALMCLGASVGGVGPR
jgi:hypothetical protein